MLETVNLPRVSFTTGISKYVQLQNQIKKMITNGELKPHSRLPSESQMAEQFSVSVFTVRQALDGLQREGLLDRVQGNGTFVRGYKSANSNRQLRSSRMLACVVGNMRWAEQDYPAMVQLIRGLNSAIDKSSYNLSITALSNRGADWPKDYILGILPPNAVAGLVLSAQELSEVEALRLAKSGLPTVMLNRYSPDHLTMSVRADICRGIYEAVDYLIGLGHRKIALLNSRNETPLGRERLAGYRAALLKAELTFDPQYVWQVDYEPPWALEATKVLFGLAAHRRPTAILTADDVIAWDVIKHVEQDGLRVPDDISIVSCTEFAGFGPKYKHMSLSTIYMPIEELGRLAMQMLLDELSGKKIENREVVLPVEFHPGGTIAAPGQ